MKNWIWNKTERLKLKFITWFDGVFKNKYCWADCVAWSFGKRWNPFKIEKGCRHESEAPCYCGRFYKGKAIDEMTVEEFEIVKNQ